MSPNRADNWIGDFRVGETQAGKKKTQTKTSAINTEKKAKFPMAHIIDFGQSKHISAFRRNKTNLKTDSIHDKSTFKLSPPRSEKSPNDQLGSVKLLPSSARDEANHKLPLKLRLPVKQFSMPIRHRSSLRKSPNIAALRDLWRLPKMKQATSEKARNVHSVETAARTLPRPKQPGMLALHHSRIENKSPFVDVEKLSQNMLTKQRMRTNSSRAQTAPEEIANKQKISPESVAKTPLNSRRFQFYSKSRRRMRRSPHRLYESVSGK
jgi:hypothetical protein